MNFVSRNVSVVNLTTDSVIKVIQTTAAAAARLQEEQLHVGAEMFFSSRGDFTLGAVTSHDRLSSEGWQNCASCHFAGLTDGVVWVFGAGPRKSVPLNGTFNPHNPDDQRVLNYSAIFDEVQDFEANIRNVSGPGPLAAAQCSQRSAAGDEHQRPGPRPAARRQRLRQPRADASINAFAKPNAGRPQCTVTLPGSTVAVPALDALNTSGCASPSARRNAPLTTRSCPAAASAPTTIAQGRALFQARAARAATAAASGRSSHKDFVSPPAAAEIATETDPRAAGRRSRRSAPSSSTASCATSARSTSASRAGATRSAPNIGAPREGGRRRWSPACRRPPPDALGNDHNGDGKGNGFNVPSLLGIHAVPPYCHNGACETLACVVADVKHRTANGTLPDAAATAAARADRRLPALDRRRHAAARRHPVAAGAQPRQRQPLASGRPWMPAFPSRS